MFCGSELGFIRGNSNLKINLDTQGYQKCTMKFLRNFNSFDIKTTVLLSTDTYQNFGSEARLTYIAKGVTYNFGIRSRNSAFWGSLIKRFKQCALGIDVEYSNRCIHINTVIRHRNLKSMIIFGIIKNNFEVQTYHKYSPKIRFASRFVSIQDKQTENFIEIGGSYKHDLDSLFKFKANSLGDLKIAYQKRISVNLNINLAARMNLNTQDIGYGLRIEFKN